jgi:hypothetical protein
MHVSLLSFWSSLVRTPTSKAETRSGKPRSLRLNRAVRGGVVGGVPGFIVYLIVGEWPFVDWVGRDQVAEGLLVVGLVAGGAFVGSWLYPRTRGRRA